MGIISRGFSGRRSAADAKLPPGQYLTTDFPVLSPGPTPHIPLDQWEFVIDDGTNVLRRWNWKSFRDLPTETFTVDLHCVTRWSKLGTSWEGWESRAAARCWAHPCCPPHDKNFPAAYRRLIICRHVAVCFHHQERQQQSIGSDCACVGLFSATREVIHPPSF